MRDRLTLTFPKPPGFPCTCRRGNLEGDAITVPAACPAHRQPHARIGEWYAERDRLRAMLEHGKDGDGWNLSPEAMDNLRADIAEVTRTINRLSGELAQWR